MGTSTRPGDVLAGRYRLIDLLSESGGGRFWRAHDAILERFVALHVIPEDDPRAPGLVEAARTSAGVLDSRILRVLDAATEDGRCFVVNEWGTGISLDILVTNAGPLEPRRAAWLVADVAGAIATAHAAGVAHGRLNPENVLVDSFGSVRLIGLCVDAALHGLPRGDVQGDVEDLGGLLYCALTAAWPGPSGSIVPAAPRENGGFLSPRQVRAGVPKPLDALWRELDGEAHRGQPGHHLRRGWRSEAPPDVSSAESICRALNEFVGDPTGMPEELAKAIPPVNQLKPVWLPAVADPPPHDDDSRDDIPLVPPAAARTHDVAAGEATQAVDLATLAAGTEAAGDHDTDEHPPDGERASDHATELPTEPGMPVFGDHDVEWLRTRSTPPPPPPPFEDPPERPLFAPDPPDGSPARRRAPGVVLPEERDAVGFMGGGAKPGGFWPWDTERPGPEDQTEESDAVPGRSWLRLAMAVAAALLLLVAIAVAFNLGRGRTPLGAEPDPEPSTQEASPTAAPVLTGIEATSFDPLGEDGMENPDQAPLALDGNRATAWSTVTYEDQLGPPPGLKTGVGLLVDLGAERQVTGVDLRVGGATAVALHVYGAAPQSAPERAPLAAAEGAGRLALVPPAQREAAARGRYVVLWLTSLPESDDGFQAEIAEVVVRGR